MNEILYILQVQECEGGIYKDLYYTNEAQLMRSYSEGILNKHVVKYDEVNGEIHRYTVQSMRIFEMVGKYKHAVVLPKVEYEIRFKDSKKS